MFSRSIRSLGVRIHRAVAPPTAPAIALVEILVAALILAAAASLFLHVLVDARAHLGETKNRSAALAIAADVVRSAQASWPDAPRRGRRLAYTWKLDCVDPPLMKSPRLALIQCKARVEWKGPFGQDRNLTLDAAWTHASTL